VPVLFFALWLCWKAGVAHEKMILSQEEADTVLAAESESEEAFPYLAVTALEQKTTPENAISINLEDYEDEVILDEEGNYILNGSLSGHILVDAKKQNIHLFLNNVTIKSEGGPAIIVPDDSGERLMITLLEGTENIISDNGDFRSYDEYDAAIDASCDIIINGSGALTVNGYYKDAIRSRDIVKILDGSYTIKCKRNGIMGNDGILVDGGNITISSEKNGFKTSNKGKNGRGNIVISGGEAAVVAGQYAFVTTKADIYIYNCTVNSKSLVGTYDCGGTAQIREGCVQ
jgi:hypothetical protein